MLSLLLSESPPPGCLGYLPRGDPVHRGLPCSAQLCGPSGQGLLGLLCFLKLPWGRKEAGETSWALVCCFRVGQVEQKHVPKPGGESVHFPSHYSKKLTATGPLPTPMRMQQRHQETEWTGLSLNATFASSLLSLIGLLKNANPYSIPEKETD